MAFSKGSSPSRDQTQVSNVCCISRQVLYHQGHLGSPISCSLLRVVVASQVVKNLPVNAGERRDSGSIPGWGRSLGGGSGNPLQPSCLENPMDRAGLPSTGSHRVGHEWSDLACTRVVNKEKNNYNYKKKMRSFKELIYSFPKWLPVLFPPWLKNSLL